MGEIRENALIERIDRRSGRRPGTLLGIGDDAAVLAVGDRAVVTCDLLVEGVHFRRSTTGMADLGHKAAAVNLSDLAAMGARPVALIVGLAIPPGLDSASIDALYDGIDGMAARAGATVAGGDVSAAPALVLAVTAVGRLAPGSEAATRSGGRPGDLLCVTGALGASAAGLALLERPDAAAGVPQADALRAAHLRPEPRVEAGMLLSRGGATALMDVSDGLVLDAGRLARASGLRARIDLDALPVAPGVAAVAAALGAHPRALAATGGEDYELLAAVPPGRLDALRAALAPLDLTVVGALEEGDGAPRVVDGDGAAVTLPAPGWEHDV
ncbi:MAG: thiamine-phosphate kinase [Thermoleophilia bacterium]